MATIKNSLKDEELQQSQIIDGGDQGVIGGQQTTQQQTQTSPMQQPQSGQSATIGGGGSTGLQSGQRQPSRSGQTFTDLGKYLEANRGAIERSDRMVQDRVNQRLQAAQGGIDRSIASIPQGNQNIDFGTQAQSYVSDLSEMTNPNSLYQARGDIVSDGGTQGMRALDRSIFSKYKTPEQFRERGMSDFMGYLGGAKDRLSENLSQYEDQRRSDIMSSIPEVDISTARSDAINSLVDNYSLRGESPRVREAFDAIAPGVDTLQREEISGLDIYGENLDPMRSELSALSDIYGSNIYDIASGDTNYLDMFQDQSEFTDYASSELDKWASDNLMTEEEWQRQEEEREKERQKQEESSSSNPDNLNYGFLDWFADQLGI